MAYSPSDFALDKSGPQFAWLGSRLDLHGFPAIRLMDDVKARVQRFQLAQGWRGTGADGLVGPETLRRLTANPRPAGIDLSIWKITLPTGEEGDPTEWFPIGTHEDAPWFVNHGAAGLTFRAPVDGVTTENSHYCRSELREMTKAGKRAEWPSGSGTHVMEGEWAITARPGGKPHVVCAQIHDAKDDVIMVRLEGARLFVESRGKDVGLLDSGYALGERFTLKITATRSGIEVEYDNPESHHATVTVPIVASGCYFKAGCYTQANESNGTGHGEVVIYSLNVTHT